MSAEPPACGQVSRVAEAAFVGPELASSNRSSPARPASIAVSLTCFRQGRFPRSGDTSPAAPDHSEGVVAAAASRGSTTRAVSPELALVDAVLAAELRTTLDLPAVESTVPHADTSPPDLGRPEEAVTAEVLYRALASPDHVDASDLIVESAGDHGSIPVVAPVAGDSLGEIDPSDEPVGDAEDEADDAAPASYPALPAPTEAGPDSMDATEVVLRQITDRLATPAPPARRRFRTRFTIASSLSAFLALGVLVLDVYFGTIPA